MPMGPGVRLRTTASVLRWLGPEGDDGVDERVRDQVGRQLIEHNAAMLGVVAVLSVPTVVLFAGVLVACGSSPAAAAAWAGLTLAATAGPAWCATRPDPADRPRWVPTTAVALVVSGCAWGSVTLLALPARDDRVAITGVMVLSVLAGNAVFGASVPATYWSFQTAVSATSVLGLAVHHPPVAPLVLVIVVYALPFAGLLGRITRVARVDAIRYAVQGDDQLAAVEAANRELAHQATHDPLTGLANRALVMEDLARALHASVGTTARVGLIFCDIDGFKQVNDSHGHGVGDEVLVEVSRRLRAQLNDGDTVGRLGGDELAVVTVRDSVGEVEDVRDRLLRCVEAPIATAAGPVVVRMSAGCAVARQGAGAEDLLHRADQAMYARKGARR